VEGGESGERGERRFPRKTWVEADHRRTNREGNPVWTTGIGGRQGEAEDTGSLWGREERSDPIQGGSPEERERARERSTRGVKTLEGRWNERRRPRRYDYYREGEANARVSKVMAKASMSLQDRGE